MGNEERYVCKEDNCTGCTACISGCPVQAINIVDSLYAYNAVIDTQKCINCKKCYSVCPQNNSPKFEEPIAWKQGWVKNAEERRQSSSGGYATAIAKAFIKDGGLVCTCIQVGNEFTFSLIENDEALKLTVGSKYVKSNPKGVFTQIKDQLRKNRKILFIGLPCQVAGLLNYIGKTASDKLYTIDLICHGTPSPKLLSFYMHNEFKKDICEFQPLKFRKDTHFALYEGEKKLLPQKMQDKYTLAFLEGIDYSENCYHCKYARTQRISDVTLGDSWGTEYTNEMSSGISLALCQNSKGLELLERANVYTYDVNIEKAICSNRQLVSPSPKPDKRDQFFEAIIHTQKFSHAIWKAYPKQSMKYFVKKILSVFNLI